jgi:hypothetical protein
MILTNSLAQTAVSPISPLGSRAEIKIRKLEWLGHVIRMEDTRIPKMIFNIKPEGRSGVGRFDLIWLDDVEADIKI